MPPITEEFESDFLFGAAEIAEFLTRLTGRDIGRKQVYQWIGSGRCPAGKHGERSLIASKRKIRTAFSEYAGAA